MKVLLSQLVNSENFKRSGFEIEDSNYFGKHYDASFNKPVVAEGDGSQQSAADDSNLLREDDIDEDQFIFPDKNDDSPVLEGLAMEN